MRKPDSKIFTRHGTQGLVLRHATIQWQLEAIHMIGYIVLSLLPGPLRRNFQCGYMRQHVGVPRMDENEALVCLSGIII